jgi:hypothetical protein
VKYHLIKPVIFFILCISLHSTKGFSQLAYCSAYAGIPCSSGDYIKSFWTAGGLVNITSLNSGCNGNPGNYISYNDSLIAYPGSTIAFQISNGPIAGCYAIFADLNANGVFDPSEKLVADSLSANDTGSVNIQFPTNLMMNSSMGIRVIYTKNIPPGSITSCGVIGNWGEIEDYHLKFINPCAQPLSVYLTASTNNLCSSNLPLTLSASIAPFSSAFSYQWIQTSAVTSQAVVLQNNSLNYLVQNSDSCYSVQVTCQFNGITQYATSNTICIPTPPCQDSVWPGDANYDHVTNNQDILALGLMFGSTGPSRINPTLNYVAQYCHDWVDTFMNGVNVKNADCTGNGIVDWNDTLAINLNYGLVHPKLSNETKEKITTLPDLYFDHSAAIIAPSAFIQLPIKLGTSFIPVEHAYGIAGTIRLINFTPSGYPALNYSSSWLANSSTTFNYYKVNNANLVDFTICKTDHLGTSGDGIIASLDLTLPPALPVNQPLIFSFENVKLIDSSGNEIAINVLSDTIGINSITANYQNGKPFSIDPNPAGDILHVSNPDIGMFQIIDMSGRIVKSSYLKTRGFSSVYIADLPTGFYSYKFSSNNSWVVSGGFLHQ